MCADLESGIILQSERTLLSAFSFPIKRAALKLKGRNVGGGTEKLRCDSNEVSLVEPVQVNSWC